nr:hypothetical protein [Methanosarcina horonobensis]
MMIPAGESDIRNQKPERKGQTVGPELEGHITPEMEAEFEDVEGGTEEEFGEEAGEEFEEETVKGNEVKTETEAREENGTEIEVPGVKKI